MWKLAVSMNFTGRHIRCQRLVREDAVTKGLVER